MTNNLNLFIRITEHLVWLTTHDEYGSTRTKGIETLTDLASELNEVGLTPGRGAWSPHSLECFMSRMKGRYGVDALREQCDLSLIDAQSWELKTGLRKTEVTPPAKIKMPWQYGKITNCDEEDAKPFRTVENDLWKAHERDEVHKDHQRKKRIVRESIRKKVEDEKISEKDSRVWHIR